MQLKGREPLTQTKLVSRETGSLETSQQDPLTSQFTKDCFNENSGTRVISSQEEEKVDRLRDVTRGEGVEPKVIAHNFGVTVTKPNPNNTSY